MPHDAKIFCIGFHKTGTSSLGNALKIMGYRVCAAVEVHNPYFRTAPLKYIQPYLAKFDAFQNNPWPLLYKELYERYPDSKFIHTTREEHAWYKSALNHFGEQRTPMREWIYGTGAPVGNEKIYLERFTKHNEEVRQFFANKPNYLQMNITEGDGWEKICSFLGKAPPSLEFPHVRPGPMPRRDST